MRKSFIFLLSFVALPLFACSKGAASSPSASSLPLSSDTSTASSSASSASSTDIPASSSEESSSLTSVAPSLFATPTNIAISQDVLSWPPVAGASAGYAVRLNQNSQTVQKVAEPTLNLLSCDLTVSLLRGDNTLEVRVESSGNFLMSAYSEPLHYVYGVNQTKVEAFRAAVKAIGTVSTASLSSINFAKAAYSALDEVDKLDSRVAPLYQELCQDDAQYFLTLVQAIAQADKPEEKTDEIAVAKDYYENHLLDQSLSVVGEALALSWSRRCDYQVLVYDGTPRLYAYAYGINVLGNKVAGEAPTLKVGSLSTAMKRGAGVFTMDLTESVELDYGGNKVADIAYVAPLTGHVYGVTDGAFGSNVEGAEDYRIAVYETSAIQDDLFLSAMPLVSLSVTQWNYSQTAIEEALYRAGYAGKALTYKVLIYGETAAGAKSSITAESLSAEVDKTVMSVLRLSAFGTISVDATSGRLVWPWEIFMTSANSQADSVDHILVDVLTESQSLSDITDTTPSFVIDYAAGDRFTYAADVVTKLKALSLGSGSYRFAAKLIAKSGSEYSDSPYYPLTDAYAYSVE